MGMWAGGQMENGPHAPTAHHMGGVLGVDSFLFLNTRGERFMDEEIPGQNLSNAILRQPPSPDATVREEGTLAWQIFDSKWPEQIEYMPEGHGAVTHYVAPEDVENYTTVLEEGSWGLVSDQMVEDGVTVKADTLEELFELMHMDPETAQTSVDRYNELCHNGEDEDFGKVASRMFPLENPPYYAVSFGLPLMLYVFGGLNCDLEGRVLDADYNPIPGLYVGGNTMGGRFLVDKPVVVAGLGLATALTFGRLAGMKAGEYATA